MVSISEDLFYFRPKRRYSCFRLPRAVATSHRLNGSRRRIGATNHHDMFADHRRWHGQRSSEQIAAHVSTTRVGTTVVTTRRVSIRRHRTIDGKWWSESRWRAERGWKAQTWIFAIRQTKAWVSAVRQAKAWISTFWSKVEQVCRNRYHHTLYSVY